tara:strand:+ start:38 stop:229 length:192 start_codon:yes stop_codon:yes gene_type:complete
MIRVFFDKPEPDNVHPDLILDTKVMATFDNQDLASKCFPILEKEAGKESLTAVAFDYDDEEIS